MSVVANVLKYLLYKVYCINFEKLHKTQEVKLSIEQWEKVLQQIKTAVDKQLGRDTQGSLRYLVQQGFLHFFGQQSDGQGDCQLNAFFKLLFDRGFKILWTTSNNEIRIEGNIPDDAAIINNYKENLNGSSDDIAGNNDDKKNIIKEVVGKAVEKIMTYKLSDKNKDSWPYDAISQIQTVLDKYRINLTNILGKNSPNVKTPIAIQKSNNMYLCVLYSLQALTEAYEKKQKVSNWT